MFSKFPFIRYLIALVIGIVIENLFSIDIITLFLLFSVGVLLLFISNTFFKKYSKNQKTIIGISSLFLIFVLGSILSYTNTQLNNKAHLYHQLKNVSFYSGIIDSEVHITPKFYKFYLKVAAFNDTKQWSNSCGKVLVYLPIQDDYKPTYGDKLLLKGKPFEVPEMRNPFDFDYKKYLANQQIHLQHFLKTGDYKYLGIGNPNIIYASAYQSRNYLKQLLTKYIEDPNSATIVCALVLGVRGNLDEEIKSAYTSTGTMHVLAVSGMHVAIIYAILVFNLGWIRRLKNGTCTYFLLIICLLWGYAFVTGLSASVLRAVTMFSIIVTADIFKRQSQIWNSIALSAFILVMINPNLIFDAGFQLSYLAVIGIVYFQPSLYALLDINNKWVDELWKILTASTAAQLAVFPLCILYFNQFPNLFLLSNLLIVPLSTIILYAGLAGIAIFHLPIFSSPFGLVISHLVNLMNKIAINLEKVPYAVSSGISITPIETILMYLMLFYLILFFKLRQLRFAIYFTLVVVTYNINTCIELVQKSKRLTLSVYNIAKQQQVEIYDGLKATVINSTNDVSIINKLKSYRNIERISSTNFEINKLNRTTELYDSNFCLVKNGIKILVINNKINYELLKEAKVIIFGRNSFEKIDSDIQLFRDKIVILDSSNDKNLSKRYFYRFRKEGINIHNVFINNALVLNLNNDLDAIRKL